jgi:hypothetical protein
VPGRTERLRAMPAVLLEPWKARGRARHMPTAALVQATAVTTWQSLVAQQELTDQEAVRILTAMVLAAATKGSRD